MHGLYCFELKIVYLKILSAAEFYTSALFMYLLSFNPYEMKQKKSKNNNQKR